MILSCPSCTTKYRANAAAIPPEGRKVKCAACGHVWLAQNEDVAFLEPIDPISPAQEPVPEPAPEPEAPKAPHRAFRERAEKQRQKTVQRAALGAWGGLGTAVAGVFLVAFLFRADIVSVWPQASSAYAAVGVEANAYGMTIDSLNVERGIDHGIPTVQLTGEIRNIDRQPRTPPTLTARLLDDHGNVVLEWTVITDDAPLRPGESRGFATIATDPPGSAHEAEITLAGLEHMPAPQQSETHHPEPSANSHDETPPASNGHH